jgi:hypothetical protein
MADLAEEAVPEARKLDPKEKKAQEKDEAKEQAEAKEQTGKKKAARTQAKGGLGPTVKKRWRAWLRAVHRDVGYLAVGFTMIYALSGIAMNHIADWDPNFRSQELQLQIAPIPDDISDDEAVARVAAVAGLSGRPSDVLRAGDEVRLEYPSGSKVTAIGDTVTVQKRESRFFFRVANWLHATRGKAVWKFIADAYAVLLLYLAISGIFMIKGKLGLRWRGTLLIGIGLAAPLTYIVVAGGPDSQKTESKSDPKAASATPPGQDDGIRPLPPDPEAPAERGEAPMRPPVRKQPPPGAHDGADDAEAPQRPPILKQPPAGAEDAEAPQRPPVRKQPPAGA